MRSMPPARRLLRTRLENWTRKAWVLPVPVHGLLKTGSIQRTWATHEFTFCGENIFVVSPPTTLGFRRRSIKVCLLLNKHVTIQMFTLSAGIWVALNYQRWIFD